MWCSPSGKLKIRAILLKTIPAGIPVGGCEALWAHGEATVGQNQPAPSWEPETSNHEPPSHTTPPSVWSLPQSLDLNVEWLSVFKLPRLGACSILEHGKDGRKLGTCPTLACGATGLRRRPTCRHRSTASCRLFLLLLSQPGVELTVRGKKGFGKEGKISGVRGHSHVLITWGILESYESAQDPSAQKRNGGQKRLWTRCCEHGQRAI